jgi:hypothetical protein
MSDLKLSKAQKDLLHHAHVQVLLGKLFISAFLVDARQSKANAAKRDAVAGLRALGLVNDSLQLSADGADAAAAAHAAWKAGK